MNLRFNASKLMKITSILVILRYTFSIVGVLPGLVRYSLLLIEVLSFIGVLICDRRYASNILKKVPLVLIICILFTLKRSYSNAYDFSITDSIRAMLAFCVPMACGAYYHTNPQDEYQKQLFSFTVICTVITCITTIVGLILFPMAAREMSMGSGNYTNYRDYNIGGFGFIYSLVVIIFLLIIITKEKTFRRNYHKILYVGTIAICSIAILEAQYSWAIILLVFTFAFSLIEKKHIRFGVFALLCIGAYLMLSTNLIVDFLRMINTLSNKMGFEMFSWKSMNIINSLTGVGYSNFEEGRIALYEKALNAIAIHPIFGNVIFGQTSNMISDHSELLDFTACFGAIGLVFLIYFLISYFAKYKASIGDDRLSAMVIDYCKIIIIICAVINQVFIATNIAIVIYMMPTWYINIRSLKNNEG